MMALSRWTILAIVALLNENTLAYTLSGGIYFPMRYVDHSINLESSSMKEVLLPTGNCDDMRNQDLSLRIPGMAPKNLYRGFIESNRVTCLVISDSSIEHISIGAFDFLTNLLYLDISRNRIEFCNLLKFGGHNELTTLIIDENNTQGNGTNLILTTVDYFPRLEHLYLRKNLLRGITVNFRQYFPSLTHLYLSDNQLEGETFDYLKLPFTLTHLHLQRNWIRRLNSRELINLSSLSLDENRIHSICSWHCHDSNHLSLRSLRQLQFLSVSRNKVSHIECDSFEDARYLKSLNFAHNSIQVILPGTFDVLHELRDLSLSHNYLLNVPDLRHVYMLTSLSIDHNLLDTISTGTFCDLPNLKWLSLGGNRIANIAIDSFVNLPALEELDLSHNRLSHLPRGWIGHGTYLRHLDIRYNQFIFIENLSLSNVLTLTHLYLQGNPLNEMETPVYWPLAHNVNVHLEYGSSVHRDLCYLECNRVYSEYSIPRLTGDDEWTW